MTTEKRNDEIDLIELFLNIYIFFKKNFWFIIISAFIGAGLGYSTKYFPTEHFESSMLIETSSLNSDILVEYINNIRTILRDGNYNYLSKKTGLEKTVLKEIEGIKAETVFNENENEKVKVKVNVKDEDEANINYIKIIVKSKSNKVFNNLSEGFLNYLNNENFVQNEIEIFVEQNKALIQKIDEEIILLEELQKKNIAQHQTKSGVSIYNEQSSFHTDLIGLLKEKQSIQKSLKFAAPYRVVEDFIVYQRPIKKTMTYTFSGGFLFGFVAMLLLIFRNINRSIKEKELN